jgi:hypothetical protein
LAKVSTITPATITHSNDTLVLAMANLGGATETEMILWIIYIGDVISAKMSAIAIDLKRITRCKLASIFTSSDHRKFLGLFGAMFGSEAARL